MTYVSTQNPVTRPAAAPPSLASKSKTFVMPNKLGIHVLRATPDLPAFIAAKPAVIKFAGDWEHAQHAPPGTLVIGQLPSTAQDEAWRPGAQNPEQAARDFVAAHREFYQAHACIPYWEGLHEIIPHDHDNLHWYARFEIERMNLLQALGFKCVIGNFAVGAPELALWPAFLPAIEAGIRHEALLGLHEYSWPWMWWLTGKYQMLPGDDQEDEGWSTLRYRKVYRQYLLPRGLQIPLVISECGIDPEVKPLLLITSTGDWNEPGSYWAAPEHESNNADPYFRQLAWYEAELGKDPYVIGMAISTWGHFNGQNRDFDIAGSPIAEKLRQRAKAHPALPFDYRKLTGAKPQADYVPPRTAYRRTYILLPQIQDTFERLEWRMAAAIGSSVQLRTLGHSADDAGVGPEAREIIAVNPQAWDAELQAWYEQHYPGAEYQALQASTPWEMALKLIPPLEDDIALAQIDPRWADYNFGEIPYDAETIGRAGCFITGLAMILRKHYQRDVTPPVLDKILVAARGAYVQDNILVWPDTIPLFPIFDQSIKDNVQRTAGQLEELLRNGWEIILRRADGGHFVYLEKVQGDTLHIIDTWDGKRKRHTADAYRGIRAARLRRTPLPEPELSGMTNISSLAPREPYRRTYVLLPQLQDTVEQLTWRTAAAIGSAEQLCTLGHSADDAGVGPLEREIIAVNPRAWGSDLKAWYDRHYPAAEYRAIETESPWEMAVQIMPPLEDDIALAQKDPRWGRYDFGAEPDPHGGAETIGRYGCFLTGFAIILRRIYGRDVTPPLLDKILVASGVGYVNDHFMAWETAIPIFPAFDGHLKDNLSRSARELERLLEDGWEIILRRADGAHFVYLERVEGDTLHIIDTWDGQRKRHAASAYRGVRAAHVKARPKRPAPAKILVGLHDLRGAEWMVSQKLRGCCLVHSVVQRKAAPLDLRHLQNAGITVIARLNWGYADGTGTLPRAEHRDAFINAIAETILTAQGVDYFHVGNEPNNRSEWPGYRTGNEFPLTPQYVTQIYNTIWEKVGGRAKLGPPPIDPYFGPGSNNRDWWTYILDNITGADALFLHAKTQTNNPAEVWSRVRFADHPLTWQYLHLRTVETSLALTPERFRVLPVFVTELNPQCVDTIGGNIGWLADNARWVHEALRYFRQEQPVNGVVFYRYERAGDQTPFGLEAMPTVLATIKKEA